MNTVDSQPEAPFGADGHAPGAGRESDMRTAILRAAAELFAEQGYASTSVRAVVEAAGCQKPTLYYYFRNKEQLFLDVLNAQCEETAKLIHAALTPPGSVRERLHRTITALVQYVRHNPTALRLWLNAERHPSNGQPAFDFDAVRQADLNNTRLLLQSGVDSGELRGDINIDETCLALFGMIDHRLVLSLHGHPIADDYPDQLLDLLFHGIGA